MTFTLFILGSIGGEIGKFLLGCLIFCGVVWVGMLITGRNDEMKRLKEQNDELRKKQKHQDAQIKYYQKKDFPEEEE